MDDRTQIQLVDYILRKIALAQAEMARAWITAVGIRQQELAREINAIDSRLERLRAKVEDQLLRGVSHDAERILPQTE